MDIGAEAFLACPARHAVAVAFAFFPTIARLLAIRLANPDIVPADNLRRLLDAPGKSLPEALVTIAVGNGFILTAMLWGAFLAELIDRRVAISSIYVLILAALTFFGVIHSASPDGVMYLPWTLPPSTQRIPYQFTLAYALLAVLLLLLAMTKGAREPARA